MPDFMAQLKDGSFDLVWGNLSRAHGDVLRTQHSTASTNYYRLDDPDLEALLQKQGRAASCGPPSGRRRGQRRLRTSTRSSRWTSSRS
ncbi:hypothetical protein ACPPVS_12950 [Cellulomonas sp. McL0617]|uniref:hypothetical protein n=1 Tax=Cellulomonas sp. McL0617 TaxID=3415675 RepID=UPI003CF203E6